MSERLQQYAVVAPEKGIMRNLPSYLLNDNAVEDSENIRYFQGKAEKVFGYEKFSANTVEGVEKIRHIKDYFMFDGSDLLVIATDTKLKYWNPTTSLFVDIGSYATGSDYNPSSTIYNNKLYITNRNDWVKRYDGTTLDNVPALDDSVADDIEGGYASCKAKLIRGFQNFLMLGNTLEDGYDTSQRLRWSRYGNPTLWKNESSGAGQAGYMDFLEDYDPIMAMELLGNALAVYKKKSIYLVSYVGPPAIFNKVRVVNDIGAISGNVVVPYKSGHYFCGLDNFYFFDGTNVTPIGDPIKKQFFGEINIAKKELIFGYLLKEFSEIWWVYPKLESDYPNYAMVFNFDTGAWSHRKMPNCMAMGSYWQTASQTWDDTVKPWGSMDMYWDENYLLYGAPKNLIGQTDGYIQDIKPYLTDFDGADIDGWMKTKLFDFKDPLHIKRLQRIQFLISREGDYNLEVIVRTADNVDESPTEYGPYYYNLQTTSPAYLDLDISARYFQFIFRTQLKAQPWKLQGMIFHYVTRGPH